MAAIAIPVMQQDDRAGSDMRRLLADAVWARSHARTTWETINLRVDTKQNRWRCETEAGEPLSTPGGTGWKELHPQLSFASNDGDPDTFSFLASGRASQSASVLILGGSNSWTLQVNPLSGKLNAKTEGGPR
jgi:Tfp pilus assembly protein FimT